MRVCVCACACVCVCTCMRVCVHCIQLGIVLPGGCWLPCTMVMKWGGGGCACVCVHVCHSDRAQPEETH